MTPRGSASSASPEAAAGLQSIQDFLHRPTGNPEPVAAEVSRREFSTEPEVTRNEFSTEPDEASAELPPLEHFLDPLPAVGEFEPSSSGATGEAWEPAPPIPTNAASETPASDWGITDWQQYDWRSVAALGEVAESDASNAWDTTDWDATGQRPPHVPRNDRPTVEQAIASALAQIAERIRAGEVALSTPGSETDPATIAATLAALFKIRQ